MSELNSYFARNFRFHVRDAYPIFRSFSGLCGGGIIFVRNFNRMIQSFGYEAVESLFSSENKSLILVLSEENIDYNSVSLPNMNRVNNKMCTLVRKGYEVN